MYLRQIDVPGVDTKFIERHKGVLTELLDAAARPDPACSRGARLRWALRFSAQARLCPVPDAPGFPWVLRAVCPHGASSRRHLWLSRAYVIENEITYLAFPIPARRWRSSAAATPSRC